MNDIESDDAFLASISVHHSRQFSGAFNEDVDEDTFEQSKILCGFKEKEIDFLPTYKIVNKAYSADRTPSYCDRILYKVVNPDVKLELTHYESLEYYESDHYPVLSEGWLTVRPKLCDIDKHKATTSFNLLFKNEC